MNFSPFLCGQRKWQRPSLTRIDYAWTFGGAYQRSDYLMMDIIPQYGLQLRLNAIAVVAAFVGQIHAYDIDTTIFPQVPARMLYDRSGDCEDSMRSTSASSNRSATMLASCWAV